MRKIVATLCAAAMAAPLAAVAAAPALAQDASFTFSVRDRDRDWRDRDRDWRDRRSDRGWYNGHRGYRERRAGYRYHDGWWFPPAAFALGAIVGGAIANEPATRYRPRGSMSARHVDWCYDRYRSYRSSDNTFQPYNGPRQQCYSPYS